MVPVSTNHTLDRMQTKSSHADESPHRERLLEAALACLGETGWSDLTIADVVRRARVSKRTFYEHFDTKDACLLALYERLSADLLDGLETAIRPFARGEERLQAGAVFYLAKLEEQPRVVRTLLLEILHLGSEGLAMRRRVIQRFAAFLRREINAQEMRSPISMAVATMIAGGINELTLEAFERDRVDRLVELAGPIAELVRGVLRAEA